MLRAAVTNRKFVYSSFEKCSAIRNAAFNQMWFYRSKAACCKVQQTQNNGYNGHDEVLVCVGDSDQKYGWSYAVTLFFSLGKSARRGERDLAQLFFPESFGIQNQVRYRNFFKVITSQKASALLWYRYNS